MKFKKMVVLKTVTMVTMVTDCCWLLFSVASDKKKNLPHDFINHFEIRKKNFQDLLGGK